VICEFHSTCTNPFDWDPTEEDEGDEGDEEDEEGEEDAVGGARP
jgi:hypothetical protein